MSMSGLLIDCRAVLTAYAILGLSTAMCCSSPAAASLSFLSVSLRGWSIRLSSRPVVLQPGTFDPFAVCSRSNSDNFVSSLGSPSQLKS